MPFDPVSITLVALVGTGTLLGFLGVAIPFGQYVYKKRYDIYYRYRRVWYYDEVPEVFGAVTQMVLEQSSEPLENAELMAFRRQVTGEQYQQVRGYDRLPPGCSFMLRNVRVLAMGDEFAGKTNRYVVYSDDYTDIENLKKSIEMRIPGFAFAPAHSKTA